MDRLPSQRPEAPIGLLTRESLSILAYVRKTYFELSPARVAAVIFLLAFGVRMAVLYWFSLYGEPKPIAFNEMELIGRSLAENNTFADPYRIPTGPTAHGAPIYPFLLSLIFRVWGYGVEARLASMVLSAAASSLQYALLPAVASACGLPRHFAVVAGLFGALVPMRLLTELDGWEAPYLATGWVVGVWLLLEWWQHPNAKTSASCGVWWGLLFLLSPQMMAVFGLAMLALAWIILRLREFGPLRWQILTGTVAVLVVLPWIVYQHERLGGWVLVRDNLPLELNVSNFPGASPFQSDNHMGSTGSGWWRHPHGSAAEAALVAEMGELAYQRSRLQEVIGWIRQDPEEFLRRTTNRIRYFWFMPSDYPKWKDLIIFPMTALSFYGLYRMIRRAPAAGMILAAGFVGYPLVYYVTNLATRYRFPIEWAILFLAAFALIDRQSHRVLLSPTAGARDAPTLPLPGARHALAQIGGIRAIAPPGGKSTMTRVYVQVQNALVRSVSIITILARTYVSTNGSTRNETSTTRTLRCTTSRHRVLLLRRRERFS